MSTHYFRFSHRRTAERQRSALLERLLARAVTSRSVTDWRAAAFSVIAPQSLPMPGVAAAALFAQQGRVDAASVFIASPVQYAAEISNVRLPTDGMVSLRQTDAEALAVDFNRVWNDAGIRLLVGRHANLFCLTDKSFNVTTHDPEDVLDQHIQSYLPAGAAAPYLRQLMSEIEMWLFEHAVNRTRLAAQLPTLNGLWLWGGGSALQTLPIVDGWTAGEDPLFQALASQSPRSAGMDGKVNESVDRIPGVAVIASSPGTDEWCAVESHWLERSVTALASGWINQIELSVGSRCFTVTARRDWKFWRRRRPWWEYFE